MNIRGFTTDSMDLLTHKNYPGNIRELAQLIDSAVLHADTKSVLPGDINSDTPLVSPFTRSKCSLKENSDRHILYILSKTGGDRHKAAEILGVSVRQVRDLMGDI